jgi:hypothetical protein
VPFANCNYNDEVKEDEMGGICSANEEKRNAYMLLVGKTEGKNHQEDQYLVLWIILKWILEVEDGVL